jgi:protein SCO1/2
MRSHLLYSLAIAVIVSCCAQRQPQNTYRLQGQVLSIEAPRRTLTIKHSEIKGLMPAMTMPYTVKDDRLLNGLTAGDLVDATLVIVSNDAYLTAITKTGQAPLEKPPADALMPSASSGPTLLEPGEEVPNASFVDQDGRKRTLNSFKGSAVVMTFIYTKCPLATFCPLMDRHFATLQTSLDGDAAKKVRLVTVSFDPATDTPPVLKQHAKALKADPTRWTFLTGNQDEIDRFAARFGVAVSRAPNDPRDITHNLRTVIIDAEGRLVKTYVGNEWTPGQVLTDLRDVIRDSGFGIHRAS